MCLILARAAATTAGSLGVGEPAGLHRTGVERRRDRVWSCRRRRCTPRRGPRTRRRPRAERKGPTHRGRVADAPQRRAGWSDATSGCPPARGRARRVFASERAVGAAVDAFTGAVGRRDRTRRAGRAGGRHHRRAGDGSSVPVLCSSRGPARNGPRVARRRPTIGPSRCRCPRCRGSSTTRRHDVAPRPAAGAPERFDGMGPRRSRSRRACSTNGSWWTCPRTACAGWRSGGRSTISRSRSARRPRPTAAGRFFVWARVPTHDPTGPYGVFALGLSGFSDVITDWVGGGRIAIHGTADPSDRGLDVSHGCVRVYNPQMRDAHRRAPRHPGVDPRVTPAPGMIGRGGRPGATAARRMSTDQAAGTRTEELLALAERYAAHNYHPLPVVIAEARGRVGHRRRGRTATSTCSRRTARSTSATAIPRLVAAAHRQLDRLTLTSRAFHNDTFPIVLPGPRRARRQGHGPHDEHRRRGRRDRDQDRPALGLRREGRRARPREDHRRRRELPRAHRHDRRLLDRPVRTGRVRTVHPGLRGRALRRRRRAARGDRRRHGRVPRRADPGRGRGDRPARRLPARRRASSAPSATCC